MTSPPVAGPPPFLENDPPPWAVRSLATVLLVLFVTAMIALFVVHVPETITARFVIMPVRGTDPVRALHAGVVSDVRVSETQRVAAGDVLFVLASELVGDRVSERESVDTRLSGGTGRLGNERLRYESQTRADEQEQHRLQDRLTALTRQAELKAQQLALGREAANRKQRGFDAGVTSWLDVNLAKVEVGQLTGDLEQVQTDITDTRNALARLTFEIAARSATFAETERGIKEDLTTFKARKNVLDRDLSRSGNVMSVGAPCGGTVVKLVVRQAGAVVAANDLLAEVVCAGEPLRAEITVPERGLALARIGQSVKLLYDAFPFERYGVQYGTLQWLSPSSTSGTDGASFRAFADLAAETVGVQGRQQPVLPGMTGRASVVVGRRSLASYAIDPVRRLRESLASAPPDPGGGLPAPNRPPR